MKPEVFPNPLVKQVAFEIRFPNLFYLQDKIGEFQTKIMRQFPKSELLFRKQLLLTSETDPQKINELQANAPDSATTSIWKFVSEDGVTLTVTPSTLALESKNHKSYAQSDNPFRKVIESTTNHFFNLTNVPILKRVGLRYIDEGPVPSNDSRSFSDNYNTAFPLKRFPIEKSIEMNFSTIIDQGRNKFRYVESLQGAGEKRKLIMDYDSSAEDIEPCNLLETTDHLHQTLWDMFCDTVKQPVMDLMRTPTESDYGSK